MQAEKEVILARQRRNDPANEEEPLEEGEEPMTDEEKAAAKKRIERIDREIQLDVAARRLH